MARLEVSHLGLVTDKHGDPFHISLEGGYCQSPRLAKPDILGTDYLHGHLHQTFSHRAVLVFHVSSAWSCLRASILAMRFCDRVRRSWSCWARRSRIVASSSRWRICGSS